MAIKLFSRDNSFFLKNLIHPSFRKNLSGKEKIKAAPPTKAFRNQRKKGLLVFFQLLRYSYKASKISHQNFFINFLAKNKVKGGVSVFQTKMLHFVALNPGSSL